MPFCSPPLRRRDDVSVQIAAGDAPPLTLVAGEVLLCSAVLAVHLLGIRHPASGARAVADVGPVHDFSYLSIV